MKKTVAIILCISMLCATMAMLSGCGKEESKFIGSWKADINMAAALNEGFAEAPEMAEYLKVDKFMVVMNFTFNEDGTYSCSMDKDSLMTALEGLKDPLAEGMTAYFKAMFDSEGLDTSVDESLGSLGIDMDSMMDQVLSSVDLDSMEDEMKTEGKYKVKDGKLFTTDSLSSEIDKNKYDVYEFDGEDLKLLEAVGADEDEELMAEMYPLTLKKVK